MDKIHELNNFLVRLNSLVNWDILIDVLSMLRSSHTPSQGGRPPFDSILGNF
ncbi:MAG: hypothetical protein LBJ00_16095 [Planctomycetaceae bacterium]|nr:hypothetical protein [Planctomycetaceae bacterium]